MNTKRAYTISEAYAYCQKMVAKHYENFPVASFLLPASKRKHIAAIYAFARYADDLADEKHDRPALLSWRQQLHQCLHSEPQHPVFIALKNTIEVFQLPISLLDDLITAFLMDLEINRFATFSELLNYCKYSANPVGRIVLYLFGYRSEKIFRLSDSICTALQLTNFWQDVSRDAQMNRIYIPIEHLTKYGLKEKDILNCQNNENFLELMKELIDKTLMFFRKGLPILNYVQGRLKWELLFTVYGGLRILKKIDHNKHNLLQLRPVLTKWDWIFVLLTQPFKMSYQPL